MMGNMKKTDQRFTLIELLVVIAIIAILAAMLMPALERARNAAMQAKCLSKQKQIGLAMTMYHNDWDGYSPVALYWDPSSNPGQYDPWDLVLAYHYMGVNRSESWWFPKARNDRWRPEVMRCRKTVGSQWWRGTYALNRRVVGSWCNTTRPYSQFLKDGRNVGGGSSDLALMFEAYRDEVTNYNWNYLDGKFEHWDPDRTYCSLTSTRNTRKPIPTLLFPVAQAVPASGAHTTWSTGSTVTDPRSLPGNLYVVRRGRHRQVLSRLPTSNAPFDPRKSHETICRDPDVGSCCVPPCGGLRFRRRRDGR